MGPGWALETPLPAGFLEGLPTGPAWETAGLQEGTFSSLFSGCSSQHHPSLRLHLTAAVRAGLQSPWRSQNQPLGRSQHSSSSGVLLRLRGLSPSSVGLFSVSFWALLIPASSLESGCSGRSVSESCCWPLLPLSLPPSGKPIPWGKLHVKMSPVVFVPDWTLTYTYHMNVS